MMKAGFKLFGAKNFFKSAAILILGLGSMLFGCGKGPGDKPLEPPIAPGERIPVEKKNVPAQPKPASPGLPGGSQEGK